MTDTVESVLAEMREVTIPAQCGDYIERGAFLAIADRLAAAHARDQADARRWRAMRPLLVAVDWQPEMGGGPVVMFECKAKSVTAGPEGADAIADAAIDAHLSGGEGGGES